MSQFPNDWFFIRNVASGLVLDVKGGSRDPGAEIILWNRKESNYDNQLWRYDEGFIINKISELVIEVPGYESGGNISPETALVQAARREQPASLNQLWAYNYEHLMPYDPKVSVGGENDDVSSPGTRAVVLPMQFHGVSQQWALESA